jgi:two-component system phosphate regulon sensor histidine kinase PhoR
MKSSLFRRLIVAAFLLIGATLALLDHTIARFEPGPQALDIRWRVLAITLAAALTALAAAYMVSRSLTKRISLLKRSAEGLLGGRAGEGLPTGSNDELGALERSFARVAAELSSMVDRLQIESGRREAILSSMAEGVLAVDADLRVIFWNSALLRAVGAPKSIPEKTRLLELIRDSKLADMLSATVRTREARKDRLKISAADGRLFEVQAAPLTVGANRGAIAVFYDITDLERLEQVRKDFVANVSHEFRTPLATVIGYSETLLEGALDDPHNNRQFIETIRTNAVRLNSIAADLLVLSQLESGIDAAALEAVPVRDAVESAFKTMGPEASIRNVTLIMEPNDAVYVLASKLRLEQVMLNLVANAVKFNRPGGEVRVRAGEGGDGTVFISVADTGIGIPAADLPRIFERFYRVDKARSREVGGTGLGLAIVRHVVERMKGSVKVESQLGRGTTFTVVLDAASREA